MIYVQAKRWTDHPVRRPDVQAYQGSLQGARASKGVFITTSRFTEDAADYVTRVQPRVVLIDGRRLADLMIEYGVGVSRFRSYELKRVDEDYFVDEEGSGRCRAAWHPMLCRMRFDHPDDHPDDPTVSVWSRLDRRGTQPEQARSFWSRPDRRRASDS
jgi:hypothetical protein